MERALKENLWGKYKSRDRKHGFYRFRGEKLSQSLENGSILLLMDFLVCREAG